MKLKKNSIQQQTSKQDVYFECITNCHIKDQSCNEECVNTLKNEYNHPWYESVEQLIRDDRDGLNRPNPPTKEAIKKAQFVDKTYVWTGR